MGEITIPGDVLAELVVRLRAIEARTAPVDPASGSNASDDNAIDALQDTPGDMGRQEIAELIASLNERQQAELVALLWIGRGDYEPEELEEAIRLALERRESPTPVYLLRQPLAAELWADALDRLGRGVSIDGTERIR